MTKHKFEVHTHYAPESDQDVEYRYQASSGEGFAITAAELGAAANTPSTPATRDEPLTLQSRA